MDGEDVRDDYGSRVIIGKKNFLVKPKWEILNVIDMRLSNTYMNRVVSSL